MIDLSTTYLGLKLKSPLVVSASPLSRDVDGICRLEDAGASAVVLYSLFEEQLRQEEADLDYHMAAGTESFAESLTYFPQASEFHTGPEGYLNHIRKAKASSRIPIIASLNGSTLGGWTKFAAKSNAPVRTRSNATSTTFRLIRSSPPPTLRKLISTFCAR
jgi:dihydroorotate dehydrogenase (fumarate)